MRIAVLLPLALLAACGKQPANDVSAAPEPKASAKADGPIAVDRTRAGQPAPTESFQGPDGKPTSLAAFRGKPVLVNLWATWCTPCVKELPTLDRLAAREAGTLQVLTLSQDSDGERGTARAQVDAFFAEKGYKNLSRHVDPENALMTALGTGNLPTTILFDAEGRELWRVEGDAEWDGAEAARLLGARASSPQAGATPAAPRA